MQWKENVRSWLRRAQKESANRITPERKRKRRDTRDWKLKRSHIFFNLSFVSTEQDSSFHFFTKQKSSQRWSKKVPNTRFRVFFFSWHHDSKSFKPLWTFFKGRRRPCWLQRTGQWRCCRRDAGTAGWPPAAPGLPVSCRTNSPGWAGEDGSSGRCLPDAEEGRTLCQEPGNIKLGCRPHWRWKCELWRRIGYFWIN